MSHLETLRPLLSVIARERTASRPDLYEDAFQEGLIRAWSVETAKPDAPREYVLAASRFAIGDLVRGRPAFGASSHRGRPDLADRALSLDAVRDTEDASRPEDPADPVASAAFLRVDESDRVAATAAAVSQLPARDQEIVRLRFTEEQTWPQIGAAFGLSAQALRVRFRDFIAPALTEALGDWSAPA